MRTKSWVVGGAAVLLLLAVVTVGFAWSGIYNVGADDRHIRPVHVFLETLRERSIAVRASDLQPPGDLGEVERIRQGAGNYDAMCVGCHLAPGMGDTELSRGLNPSPPNLSKESVDASVAFWAIKHGIKASGMPAWGGSMGDEYIWNMAAFVQELPGLDAARYQALVASSGGHDHGGGETGGHAHAEDPAPGHHDEGMSDQAGPAMVTHRHADGTVESHPAPASAEPPAASSGSAEPESHDDHDHQH